MTFEIFFFIFSRLSCAFFFFFLCHLYILLPCTCYVIIERKKKNARLYICFVVLFPENFDELFHHLWPLWSVQPWPDHCF